jgi:hypothetical protein
MTSTTIKRAAVVATSIAATAASYFAVGSPSAPDEPSMTATFIQQTAATYFGVNAQDKPGGPTDGSGAQQTPPGDGGPGDDLTLCVGIDDQVLRLPPGFAGECPEGQWELDLSDEDDQICELCDPFDAGPPAPKSDHEAINALEQRIRDLEKTPYFEVVSQKDETTIFRIGPGGARFFNPAGTAVAAVGTGEAGAFFTARSAVTTVEASIGASGNNGGVAIFENGLRSELGAREGPHALRFPSGKGLIAGLGQSRAGSGAVIVGRLTGTTEASVTVTDGRGFVALSKDGAAGGAAIAEALIGGGVLDLAIARGGSAVKMGHNSHRYGIVMAGPVLGVPYVPRTGVPGSYFVGCASGESPACIPEVAGQ